MCTPGCVQGAKRSKMHTRVPRRLLRNIPNLQVYRKEFRRLHTSSIHFKVKKLRWSYVQGLSDRPLFGATIGQFLDSAVEKWPTREAFVVKHADLRVTFEELKVESEKLATGLLALGLKPGDRVGMWGPNCIEWVYTQYATAKAGMILVNINPAYQVPELEYALGKVGCKALISADYFKTQDYYEMLFNINSELAYCKPGELHNPNLPELTTIIMLGKEKQPGTFTFDEVMNFGGSDQKMELEDIESKLQFDQPINIQFTSGTTGYPKGALLSHHNIINNGYFTGMRCGYHEKYNRICVPVPMYHCFGMVLGSLQTVLHGATCVFPAPSFQPAATLKAAQEEMCTSMYGTPTMFIDMLNHPDFNQYDLTTLYTGVMAGSPCPIEIMKQVITKMNMERVTIVYGTTENSPTTFQSYMDDPLDKRVSTVGCAAPHVEAKVINEQGEVLPVFTPGELCIRGYNVMLRYWDDHDKTDEVIKPDRWYHTGDIAYFDDEGYCIIAGRIKDMIIRGGENIYPTEIEQFLYNFPKIEDVQVIGVPDERLGEEVCAWVKLHKGETATAEEIKEFCKGKISHFKIPKYIKFVGEFPLTVTGKVQKFKMRQAAIKDLQLEHVKPHL